MVTHSSELVAAVFPNQETSEAALKELKQFGAESLGAVGPALVVHKDEQGHVGVSKADLDKETDEPGLPLSALLERAAEALGDAAEHMKDVLPRQDKGAGESEGLGYLLKPGATAIGLVVQTEHARGLADELTKLHGVVLSHEELHKIGAGHMLNVAAEGALAADKRTEVAVAPATGMAATGKFDWRAEYAYALGLQAFIYGFPYMYSAQTRWKWVTQPRNPQFVPYAAVNHFWHAQHVVDATYQDGGCPNNDALYSIAWVDVTHEPVILSVPDTHDRYYTFQLAALFSDNFASVGRRTTGTKPGHYAIIGTHWQGELPAGVQALPTSPTPWVLVLGRTLVEGVEDEPNVHRLQEQYHLTPLSLYGTNHEVPERRDVLAPGDPQQDPLAPWKLLNAVLAENPPLARHDQLMKQFATIGIGPDLDVTQQDEVTKQNLVRAALTGMQLLKQYFLSGSSTTLVHGWRYPTRKIGRAGDDFLLRAAGQSLAGIAALDPEEAVYLVNFTDESGEKLTGKHRYELHFAAGQEPPVDAFWSLTMYANYNLVPNPHNRYSIGDRTKGVQRDAEGGLTIYIQHESPGKDKESNWLPAPQGEFFVVLRLYQPRAEVIEAIWEGPPLKKVG